MYSVMQFFLWTMAFLGSQENQNSHCLQLGNQEKEEKKLGNQEKKKKNLNDQIHIPF